MSSDFDEADKRAIAGRALTLVERIESPELLTDDRPAAPSPDAIMERWRSQFPDVEAFDRRLETLGKTRVECKEALTGTVLAADQHIPKWIERIDDLAASLRERSDNSTLDSHRTPSSFDDQSIVFRRFVGAIGKFARDLLPESAVERISSNAVDDMVCWFAMRFHRRFSEIFVTEFQRFVAAKDPGVASADPDEFNKPPHEQYDRFQKYLFSGGFEDFCYEYPMFARVLSTQIRQWVDCLTEFGRRLETDDEALAATFAADDDALGQVTALTPLANDTHGDGRAVLRVDFESGTTVVYKPRSIDTGVAFYQALDRLGDRLAIPQWKTPVSISRDEYGWTEWFEARECDSVEAVKRYYQRVGVLVCLAYIFEWTDCHYENIVAAGEYPILVDAETLFHPYLDGDRRPTRPESRGIPDDNVLMTLLLPFDIVDPYSGDPVGSIAPIAGVSRSSKTFEFGPAVEPRLKFPESDLMSIEYHPETVDLHGTVPRIDGRDCPPADYVDEITEGFVNAYSGIRSADEATIEVLGFSAEIRTVENRLMFRKTERYKELLRSLLSPRCLRDGGLFGSELERLAVPFCDGRIDDPPWPLFAAERRALTRLDYPRFTSQPGEKEISLSNTPTGVDADCSGLDRSQCRIAEMDLTDQQCQLEYVRGAFGQTPCPTADDTSTLDDRPQTDDDLQAEAAELFDRIMRVAVRSGDDASYFSSVAPFTESDRITVIPSNDSLAIGQCGVGVFAAALYRLTEDDRYRRSGLEIVRPVLDRVSGKQIGQSLSTYGGAMGVGGIAYGLGTAGTMLEAPDLLSEALTVASRIPDPDATTNGGGGAPVAGTVLGLLGLDDRVGSSAPLETAIKYGDTLLTSESARTEWQRATTGYALARLWNTTGEYKYRDAALDAFSSLVGGSEDGHVAQVPTGETSRTGWYVGQLGIELAATGAATYISEPDITGATNGQCGNDLASHDHLWNGTLRRVELQLIARGAHGIKSSNARLTLGRVLERAKRNGGYRLPGETQALVDPTFANGLSGIGYTLLRAVNPGTVPSVLLYK